MKSNRSRYSGYRFPSQIISYAVWAYHRFCLSFRDVEDLLAERGIIVSYETIRQWCEKFGLDYARKLKRREGRLGDHWHLDEVFRINGQQRYLWRAVDQDGDFTMYLNPNSLQIVQGKAEASLAKAKPGDRYQFERLGYFCADQCSSANKLVFNRTVELRDTWAKLQKKI